jgi:SOS-response transcriptional repressor LexA
MARPCTTIETPITPRQQEILRLIVEAVRKAGRYPTLREVMATVALKSTNAINCHLTALRRKGYLAWPDGGEKWRSWVVVGLEVSVAPADDDAGRRLAAALSDVPLAPRATSCGVCGQPLAHIEHRPAKQFCSRRCGRSARQARAA